MKILTELQNFVRMYDSLKCMNSYWKLIAHCSYLECIEIVQIWFLVYTNLTLLGAMVQKEFDIKVTLASNTDWSISQNGNYSYVGQNW